VPLPRHPYDTARVVYRVCSIDGFVAWAATPTPCPTTTSPICCRSASPSASSSSTPPTCAASRVTSSRRAALGLKLDPAGLHPRPSGRAPIDLDQLRVAFEQMGEQAPPSSSTAHERGTAARLGRIRRARSCSCASATRTDEISTARSVTPRRLARSSHARRAHPRRARRPRTLDEYVAERPSPHRRRSASPHCAARPHRVRPLARAPQHSTPRWHPEETTAWPSESTARIEAGQRRRGPGDEPSSSSDSDDTSSSSD
jgi:hypothetical protein